MALYVTRPRRDEVRIGRGLPSDPPPPVEILDPPGGHKYSEEGGSDLKHIFFLGICLLHQGNKS